MEDTCIPFYKDEEGNYVDIYKTDSWLKDIYNVIYCSREYNLSLKKQIHFLYDRLYSDCFLLFFLIDIYFSPTVIRKSIDSISPWLTLQTISFKTLKNLGFISIAGHIVLTMPIPILIYIILRASVKKISIISILAGIFIEPIQLLINLITGFPNYVIDIDDFMLQIAGILVGLFIITLAGKYHILNWLKEWTVFIFKEGVHFCALFLFGVPGGHTF